MASEINALQLPSCHLGCSNQKVVFRLAEAKRYVWPWVCRTYAISTKKNLALQQIWYILLIWHTNGLKETRQKDKISHRTTESNPNSTCRKNQRQTEKHFWLRNRGHTTLHTNSNQNRQSPQETS